MTRPYMLYVGAAYPHKNVGSLIQAWKIFVERYGNNYELVLVGKKDSFWERLEATYHMSDLQGCRYLGFVSDDELDGLYSDAAAFVFPSLYEGFGLPPLEAMAHGLPVVSSDRSCLKEILRDAALYMNPEKPEEIAEALYRVVTDVSFRKDLIQKGRQQAQKYSWDTLVQSTLDAYTRIG